MNLADLIARNAAFAPAKTAIRFEGEAITYADLAGRIDRVARVLSQRFRIRAGDRVAILSLNRPETLVLLYACARVGALLVPLNWRLAGPELVYILADADVSLLFHETAFAPLLPALLDAVPGADAIALDGPATGEPRWADVMGEETEPDATASGQFSDPVLLVYTSGTTGRPKGAILRQEALVANAAMSQHLHNFTSDDHVLTVLPFFHVGGLNIQTTAALQLGATVTVHPRFTPKATLTAFAGDRPTHTVLVPATIEALVADPGFASADLSGLRAITTGSTYVPEALVDAIESRGVPLLQVYGATETSPTAIYTRLGGDRSRAGSTGLPGLLCEAEIVDEAGRPVPAGTPGEIRVRGPNVFAGYWRNEAATLEVLQHGWFATGDIATADPDGYVTVHDRRRNLIISGGENVYPAEVERVLLAHPAVAECAVVGRPDPRWGEVPVAYVVRRPGRPCDEASLVAHVQAELARFKAPRAVVFIDTLPRNALGKVQHFLLRDAG